VPEFTDTWNDTFKAHWGFTPFIADEVALLFEAFTPVGMLETSVMAYRDGVPVGAVFHGVQYLSYTIVLDDNWPSRRTAEKSDAFVCANSLVYRRNFRR